MMKARKIPAATIARLPIYLRSLVDVAGRGARAISSEELARLSGSNAAQVRKDFSHLGEFGTRGVGYDPDYLIRQIAKALGLARDRTMVVVGAGHLGTALVNYRGFPEKGFRVIAVFDRDLRKIGKRLGDLAVENIADVKAVLERVGGADVGVIATPAPAAQGAADALVEAGVSGILNFAPVAVEVPPQVHLRHVDLSVELQILSFYLSEGVRKSAR